MAVKARSEGSSTDIVFTHVEIPNKIKSRRAEWVEQCLAEIVSASKQGRGIHLPHEALHLTGLVKQRIILLELARQGRLPGIALRSDAVRHVLVLTPGLLTLPVGR
jgi:hypothetical protein